jgi:molybdenum cofactor cytidylyltransferase
MSRDPAQASSPPLPAVAALVLAAGGAQRMGGRPKCLLEMEGEALVRRLVGALKAVLSGPVVVVTGGHAPAVTAALKGMPVTLVHHADWAQGASTSVQAGLAALSHWPQPVLVALADMPAIGRTELEALLQAWTQRPADTEVLVPMVDGQRGNPVLLSASVCEAVRTDARWPSPRDWQGAHPQAVHRWATGETAYRLDVDTPDDLAHFNALGLGVLRWPKGL